MSMLRNLKEVESNLSASDATKKIDTVASSHVHRGIVNGNCTPVYTISGASSTKKPDIFDIFLANCIDISGTECTAAGQKNQLNIDHAHSKTVYFYALCFTEYLPRSFLFHHSSS